MPSATISLEFKPEWYGWRPVHYDPVRDVVTLERTRRFFKGAYRVVTVAALAKEIAALVRISEAKR